MSDYGPGSRWSIALTAQVLAQSRDRAVSFVSAQLMGNPQIESYLFQTGAEAPSLWRPIEVAPKDGQQFIGLDSATSGLTPTLRTPPAARAEHGASDRNADIAVMLIGNGCAVCDASHIGEYVPEALTRQSGSPNPDRTTFSTRQGAVNPWSGDFSCTVDYSAA